MKKLLLLALVAGAAASQADVTIDTLSGWNGTDSINSFGVSDTSTYGQTFKVTTAPLLMTYEFQLESQQVDEGFHAFNLYVMAWDDVNNHATGPVLYKSGDQFLVDSGTWQDFTVAPNVMLNANSKYVAFISTSESNRDVNWASMQAGRGGTDAYADGQFMFTNNGADTNGWTNNTWSSWSTNDTAFKAVFCGPAVPEPTTIVGLGLSVIGFIRKKRKQS